MESSQINWDVIFNEGKAKFINNLVSHKIDQNILTQYGAPLINALYGLKDYMIADASKYDTISPATKQYITSKVVPAMNQSIDNYWNNLGYVKKASFKMLAQRNQRAIMGTIGSALNSLTYGFTAGLQASGSKNTNLFSLFDSLNDFMGGIQSPVTVGAIYKIQSLT